MRFQVVLKLGEKLDPGSFQVGDPRVEMKVGSTSLALPTALSGCMVAVHG